MTSDEIFDALVSPDNGCAKACLEQMGGMKSDPQLLAYVLNLHLFHESPKVRGLAEELFKKHAPQDLIDQVAAQWQHKYRRHQESGIRWMHPAIDTGEFMLISQMTRKNYYAKHPKAGMNGYASMRFGVEIEQVLDCFGGNLRTLPDKVVHMQHIAAVSFGLQESLDLRDIVEKLSKLRALTFLLIYKCKVEKLPDNFSQLANLERLELSDGPIGELGAHVQLPNVKYLSIINTKINLLDMRNFPALETLKIEDERRLKEVKLENVTRPFLATSGPNGFKLQVNPQ